ncbi:hypothetical protein [Burkholderia pseudomallei]|uniref:hypothetical protein n=1 Tax=Burkholderia pseudomallei TaxID=28450 RepID=UPI0015C38601|nr:hypothetical protein [Burkholderia pseudomallei]
MKSVSVISRLDEKQLTTPSFSTGIIVSAGPLERRPAHPRQPEYASLLSANLPWMYIALHTATGEMSRSLLGRRLPHNPEHEESVGSIDGHSVHAAPWQRDVALPPNKDSHMKYA